MEEKKKKFYINQDLFMKFVNNQRPLYYLFHRPGAWVSVGVEDRKFHLSSISLMKWDLLPENCQSVIFSKGTLFFEIINHFNPESERQIISFPFIASSLFQYVNEYMFGTRTLVHPILEITLRNEGSELFHSQQFENFLNDLYYLHPNERQSNSNDYFLNIIKNHEKRAE